MPRECALKTVPSVIGDRPNGSTAERIVFDLLRGSKVPGVAFHSLLLSQHEINPTGEADFVVVSPKGLLVIEVKGGTVAREEDGIWSFTGRDGTAREQRGPFKQAEEAMWSLVGLLRREQAGHHLDEIAFGYAVAFPQCEFDVRSVEWDPACIWDRSRERSESFDKWLTGAFAHWRNQSGKRTAGDRCVEGLAHVLRPVFHCVPSLTARVENLEGHMHRLTDTQLQKLAILEHHPRVICKGGAGTGKTVLATETARLLAAGHETVLLTCENPVLASFLAGRLQNEPVEVISHDRLTDVDQPVDVLIVDETQDILDSNGLAALDRVVKGGLENGSWRMFLDPNTQADFVGRFDPDALSFLEELGVSAVLTDNCRNSREVVTNTTLMTGADIGTAALGSGPGVDTVIYRTRTEATSSAAAKITDLFRDGVSPGDITLLSPVPFEESTFSQMTAELRNMIVRIDENVAFEWPSASVTFAQISTFKGFENRFILVSDLDDVTGDARTVASLYVAMSRARASLWLALTESAQERLLPVIAENASLVLGYLEEDENG